MPKLVSVEEISAPQEQSASTVRRYASPDEQWIALYHAPYEWHMGALGWDMRLLPQDSPIVTSHPQLEEECKDRSFVCPTAYQPWRYDSKVLALFSWDNGLIFYNLATDSIQSPAQAAAVPLEAQWAPARPLLLIAYPRYCCLLDGSDGLLGAEQIWTSPTLEYSATGWMHSGDFAFVVGRSSRRAKTRISFIQVDDPTITASYYLDPQDTLPYDAAKYKAIQRDRYALLVSPSTRSVGSLLDVWHTVRVNQATNTMLLATYRPIGEPYPLDGHLVCEVQERWVQATLSE